MKNYTHASPLQVAWGAPYCVAAKMFRLWPLVIERVGTWNYQSQPEFMAAYRIEKNWSDRC